MEITRFGRERSVNVLLRLRMGGFKGELGVDLGVEERRLTA